MAGLNLMIAKSADFGTKTADFTDFEKLWILKKKPWNSQNPSKSADFYVK